MGGTDVKCEFRETKLNRQRSSFTNDKNERAKQFNKVGTKYGDAGRHRTGGCAERNSYFSPQCSEFHHRHPTRRISSDSFPSSVSDAPTHTLRTLNQKCLFARI